MKGITIGTYHSFDDLHMILNSKEIGSPVAKVRKIDIEGADGSLDLTDFFGDVKFENVTHKFNFSIVASPSEFPSLFSNIKNAIHGAKKQIILDDDPLFYYMGRVSVSGFMAEKNIGIISLECDCEPYKYKLEKTVVSREVNGTEVITLTNSRKHAVPEIQIVSESGLNIVFQGTNVWDLGGGSYTLPELELVAGENSVTVTGTGTITFTWQEGSL